MIDNLRNHDKPCRHGELWHHAYQLEPEVLWCPGGEPVFIDYTAAAEARDSGYDAIAVVDAALGLTDT